MAKFDPNACTCGAVKHTPFPCIPKGMHGKFCIYLRNTKHVIGKCTQDPPQSVCDKCKTGTKKEADPKVGDGSDS